MKRISNERMIEALRKARGFQSAAAAILGCNRKTVADRINREPSVRDAYTEMTEQHLDDAESKLMEAVEDGHPWAIQYLLDNKGLSRGFGRREVRIKSETDVNLRAIPPVDDAEIRARIAALGVVSTRDD